MLEKEQTYFDEHNRMNTETLLSEDRPVPVDGKHFIGIGKMMINNLSSVWNIPHIHFIINKTSDGIYEATNIEFILDASGNTIEEAVEDLSGMTMYYISEVMSPKGVGFNEFIEKANSRVMEGYWQAYRNIEFKLAEQGKDLSHDLSNKINAAIKNMLAESIKQRINEIAENIVDTIITHINIEIFTMEAA
jgi:hypothetical protein